MRIRQGVQRAEERKRRELALRAFLSKRLSYDKKLKKTSDGRAIYVYPKGTRRHGNKRRAAEVAFVDEFGKQGQPARPFIQTANEKAADPATDAAARVYDGFLKSKNF